MSVPPDAIRFELYAVVPCPEDPPHHLLCRCGSLGTISRPTGIVVEQRESPFMVVGRDNPEGPSIVGRKDGWYPVEAEG